MTNFEVYKKTLSFSLLMFATGLLSLALFGGAMVGGYFLLEVTTNNGIGGLVIGAVVGIVILILFTIFVNNRIKAAQIAMITKGVVDGNLPENTFKAGFEEVKGRFSKLTLFFMITGAIKGIFRQLGRSLNRVGRAVGGKAGDTVTSVIDSAIQTLVGYLCDCCLGWVMYHKEEKMTVAACQGAVIFFKHGKTLLRNAGRIFGMMAASFVVIGGIFFGISYLILMNFPEMSSAIAAEVGTWSGEMPEFFKTPTGMTILVSAVIAIMLWSTVHSVLVHPFILTGVLRNFMEAGMKDKPTEKDFVELDSKSSRFAKLRAKEQM